ncbi:MAG: hypothetical protein ACK4SI_15515 [Brevundimonas aurantiaca]|jgi:hypothetical protein|uniref:hypothetical protein n=1 Tax=Brevundimonas aurantiaca TaxID=74316 RepID=UPI00391C5FC6
METFPWGFVVIGGPVILGLAIAWGYFRSARRDAQTDAETPADDPSKGMPGHDRAPSTGREGPPASSSIDGSGR